MKLIIAGSRKIGVYENVHKFDKWLEEELHSHNWKPTEIVSGAAYGVDELGEAWAKQHNIPVTRFPVTNEDWATYGGKAGILRNMHMAHYADALFYFWDGKSPGTVWMAAMMKSLGKPYTGRGEMIFFGKEGLP